MLNKYRFLFLLSLILPLLIFAGFIRNSSSEDIGSTIEERFVAEEVIIMPKAAPIDLFWTEAVTSRLNTTSLYDQDVCERIARTTLIDFSGFLDGFKYLEIHDDKSKRRGLSNGNTIYLRCLANKDEYLDVLIHELGHSVDLLFLKPGDHNEKSLYLDYGKTVYISDKSVNFYNISWIDSENKKSDTINKDFVSKYAMTDPFEDFAETFVFYVRYGEIFRYLIEIPENRALRLKYNYMKNDIFEGQEFNQGYQLSDKALLIFNKHQSSIFDVTKLSDLV